MKIREFFTLLRKSAAAMIYKYVPRVHIAWHDVWIGAAVTAVLFEILLGAEFTRVYAYREGSRADEEPPPPPPQRQGRPIKPPKS